MDPDLFPCAACLYPPPECTTAPPPPPSSPRVTAAAIHDLKMAERACVLERFLQDSVAAAHDAQEADADHKRERSQYASAGSISAMTSSGSGVTDCGGGG